MLHLLVEQIMVEDDAITIKYIIPTGESCWLLPRGNMQKAPLCTAGMSGDSDSICPKHLRATLEFRGEEKVGQFRTAVCSCCRIAVPTLAYQILKIHATHTMRAVT